MAPRPEWPSPLRLLDPQHRPDRFINRIVCGDAREVLRALPDGCVALAVTSPPYWNMVDYGVEGQIGQCSYEEYLGQLLEVWLETERVLLPNGKLAIITPIMPIPKSVMPDQHTRHLKNLSSDIEHTILSAIPSLQRFSLFVWQKQTTVKMFGSYPYPPNIYEDNTVEFINVLVKDGPPIGVPQAVKEASKLTQEQWLNLTMQVWPMYPEDIRRAGGHPCPFPVVLPQRLIMMYTFRGVPEAGFEGDLVLDMFNGTGATCVAAASTGRTYLGIDLSPDFCRIAEQRVATERANESAIMLAKVKVRRAHRGEGARTLPDTRR
jgi:DNA modification methylase